jgi:hypothetical protein
MAMPLEIECLWHSDKTKPLADAGLDFKLEDVEYKTMTFYHINAIMPYEWEKGHDFCKILTNSDYWIVPYTYEEVKAMVEKI